MGALPSLSAAVSATDLTLSLFEELGLCDIHQSLSATHCM